MLRFLFNTIIVASFVSCDSSAVCAGEFVQVGVVRDDRINESSGLAISRQHQDALWVHNDSGDKARLYLIGVDGRMQAKVDLENVKAHDWEDMCSFELNGKPWLLIGDVGDNDKRRGEKDPDCRLHLVAEPKISDLTGEPKVTVKVTATVRFVYEDGPQNCEGIAVDTDRREILLITKSRPDKCGLYVLPLDITDAGRKRIARRIASPFLPFATALDISPSSRTMVIGSMFSGLLVQRTESQSWADALSTAAQPLNLPERRQGETLCFDRSGTVLFLNSEHKDQPLWRGTIPLNSGDQ